MSNQLNNKLLGYTWDTNNDYDETAIDHSIFKTIDECIIDAKDYGIESGTPIFIFECIDYAPSVNASKVLEVLEDDAFDRVGDAMVDWIAYDARGYLHIKLLQEKLDTALLEWLTETKQIPNFYQREIYKTVIVK